jgi:hypothetical protein
MLAAIFALCTKQYIIGMLILFYVQIQLSEAMIWKGIDSDDINLNKTGTMYGKYLLPTHLFAIGLGYLLSILLMKKRKLKYYDFIPITIGIFFYLFIILGPYRNKNYEDVTYPQNKSCMDRDCQNTSNRLSWKYPYEWYSVLFILSLFFLIIFVKPVYSLIFMFLIFTISLAVIYLIYPDGVVGSMWCFSAAILAPIIVIVNYFIIRNKKDSDILT